MAEGPLPVAADELEVDKVYLSYDGASNSLEFIKIVRINRYRNSLVKRLDSPHAAVWENYIRPDGKIQKLGLFLKDGARKITGNEVVSGKIYDVDYHGFGTYPVQLTLQPGKNRTLFEYQEVSPDGTTWNTLNYHTKRGTLEEVLNPLSNVNLSLGLNRTVNHKKLYKLTDFHYFTSIPGITIGRAPLNLIIQVEKNAYNRRQPALQAWQSWQNGFPLEASRQNNMGMNVNYSSAAVPKASSSGWFSRIFGSRTARRAGNSRRKRTRRHRK